jgi:hypothetical protein
MTKLIVPQWPLPEGVAACSSTRIGGVSQPRGSRLNLGAHCGDNLQHVKRTVGGCLLREPVETGLAGTGSWQGGAEAGRRALCFKRADASYSNTGNGLCRDDRRLSAGSFL